VVKNDPIRQFEHSHGRLSALALDVAACLRATEALPTDRTWEQLCGSLDLLRDELLRHFADEEEGLFPFVRASVPDKSQTVERLEAAHDTICGAAVRMFHIASGERHLPQVAALYERFARAFARHSAEETELLEGLARALDGEQRLELSDRLRGL
jgi:iron-sulfur cluster repair protein YtfE (RIC family)